MFNRHALLKILPRRFRPLKAAVKMHFFNAFGYKLDLDNPKTFSEKINWLKCYDRNPLITQCSDKYGVRDYVTDRVGAHILNELLGVYEDANDIDFAALPNRCVLKVTHGSGWNVLVKDGDYFIRKKRLDSVKHAKSRLKRWLKKKQHIRYQEWGYKNVPPKVVCEKYLENDRDNLTDYKIHCFNGEPHFIQTITDRKAGGFETFYDTEWQAQPLRLTYPPIKGEFPRPACLPEMLEVARALSAPFPYVRVDLYEQNDRPIFGEMTFYPASGYSDFKPPEWDAKFGELIVLPVGRHEN